MNSRRGSVSTPSKVAVAVLAITVSSAALVRVVNGDSMGVGWLGPAVVAAPLALFLIAFLLPLVPGTIAASNLRKAHPGALVISGRTNSGLSEALGIARSKGRSRIINLLVDDRGITYFEGRGKSIPLRFFAWQDVASVGEAAFGSSIYAPLGITLCQGQPPTIATFRVSTLTPPRLRLARPAEVGELVNRILGIQALAAHKDSR